MCEAHHRKVKGVWGNQENAVPEQVCRDARALRVCDAVMSAEDRVVLSPRKTNNDFFWKMIEKHYICVDE